MDKLVLVIKKKYKIKYLAAILFALLSFLNLSSQDINAMIREADRLEFVPDETAAFLKFKDVVNLQPSNVYALSKCSELCCRIGKRQTDLKAKEDFYRAAKTFADVAVKVDPGSSDANCAMAMALGHISMNKTNKEKIASAKDLKKYVDLAIKINPNNYKAWHVLGRWNYEISDLSMLERAAAKVLYGGVPTATLAASITSFEKARSLTGNAFAINSFELARAYERNNERKKAIEIMTAMLAFPITTNADPGIKEEGKKLLAKWQ